MDSKVLSILKELMSSPSFSATHMEKEAVDKLVGLLNKIDYFKNEPDSCGLHQIEGDVLNRAIVYGIVRGNSPKTIILLGHYDIVGIEDFGNQKEFAFDIERLPKILSEMKIPEEAKQDIESGDWIFGRGTADMKGGIAVALACLEEYSKLDKKEGNVIFLAVPDEESYSVGMRAAISLLLKWKERDSLQYKLLLNLEPNARSGEEQIVSTGSAGKCMPVVLVQGKKVHVSNCFEGLNPLGILGEIYSATELSIDFSDFFEGESTVPPTWLYFKDRKASYDVSVPLRAAGYFNVISFYSTPDELLEKLTSLSNCAFQTYISKMKSKYQRYQKTGESKEIHQIDYPAKVLTFKELVEQCIKKQGEEFLQFYDLLLKRAEAKIHTNESNYPQTTIEIMEEVLNFSGIVEPIVLLAFSPPYYPPVNSYRMSGKGELARTLFHRIRSYAKEQLGVTLQSEQYFTGISDCSYCGIEKPFDYHSFAKNTPIWGDSYSIDFETMKELQIPFFLLGPWGKDLHMLTERVNKKSLTQELPKLVLEMIQISLNDNIQ